MGKLGSRIAWLIAVVVIIIVVWGLSSNNSNKSVDLSEGPIKIGFAGPLSGDVANSGENAKAAIELAVEDVNSSGGIDGREL
jgi:branched-chain amino acid transport system substrate-binding protein